MLPRLYLLRHGETEWSQSGRHTGRTDVPLTENGMEEARELGARLRSVVFSRVFVSPRRRALQTCDLAAPSIRPEIDPDLAEWNYGDYEGRTTAEIVGQRPGWNLFRDGCPNGESPAAVSARADLVISRVRGLSGNIAVFSHGHFGRVLAARWIGHPAGDGERFLLGTASLSILGYEHDDAAEPVIALWNETGRAAR